MRPVIRKIVTLVEETRREAERDVDPPIRRAVAVAMLENPFAGKFVEDLSLLIDMGDQLGGLLAERAVVALGIEGP
jgi:hypothetical protein